MKIPLQTVTAIPLLETFYYPNLHLLSQGTSFFRLTILYGLWSRLVKMALLFTQSLRHFCTWQIVTLIFMTSTIRSGRATWMPLCEKRSYYLDQHKNIQRQRIRTSEANWSYQPLCSYYLSLTTTNFCVAVQVDLYGKPCMRNRTSLLSIGNYPRPGILQPLADKVAEYHQSLH